MKTAFLIYRPVMDYEESETSYLICSNRKKAERAVSAMIAFAKELLASLESLYDEEGECLPDDAYFEVEQRNDIKMKNPKWPFGIGLDGDLPWRQWNPAFDTNCLAIKELPLV